MKNVILGTLIVLGLVGCGTSDQGDVVIHEGNTTVIIEQGDINNTLPAPTIPELPVVDPELPVIPVVPTQGYVNDPYPFFQNDSYIINDPNYGPTYFISNIMDVNMTLKVNPKITNVVYDVVLYDDLYNIVDPVTYIGEWTFLIPERGFYNIEIKTYESVEVVLSVDGWDN